MHKPISLEDFDKEFFSEIKKSEEEKTETEVISSEEDVTAEPISTENEAVTAENEAEGTEKEATEAMPDDENSQGADEKDILGGVDFSDMPITAAQLKTMLGRDFGKKPDKVFHDLPEGEPSGVQDESGTVSQQEAEASFPVIDFDPEKLKPALEEDIEDRKKRKTAEKEELKAHRNTAKKSIEEEKQKIREQKKLEKKVRKPFRIRKFLVFLLVLLLLSGLVFTAFGALLFLSDTPKEDVSENLRYYPYYADGKTVVRNKGENTLMIVDCEGPVQGGKEVIIEDEDALSVGTVLFAGDNKYTIDIRTGTKSVKKEDIKGCVVFVFPTFSAMPLIYRMCADPTTGAIAVILIYYVAVCAIFACLIKKQNEKIRRFRESYVLI